MDADAPSGAGQAVTSLWMVKEEAMPQRDQTAVLISSSSSESLQVQTSQASSFSSSHAALQSLYSDKLLPLPE